MPRLTALDHDNHALQADAGKAGQMRNKAGDTMKNAILSTLAASLLAASLAAHADITIGVVGSFTGPAAAIGTEIRKAAELIPTEFNGEKITVIALDDATDPTTAVRNTSKLISENKVDVIIGPVVVALAAAMAEPVSTGKTPLIVVAPYVPPPSYQPWVFPAVQSAGLMIERIVDDMVDRKIKTVGYVGFADAWGDLAFNEFKKAVARTDIKIVAEER